MLQCVPLDMLIEAPEIVLVPAVMSFVHWIFNHSLYDTENGTKL